MHPSLPVVSIPGRNVRAPKNLALGISTARCVIPLQLKVCITVDRIKLYTTANRPRKHRPTRLGRVPVSITIMVSPLLVRMFVVHTGRPRLRPWPIYNLLRLKVPITPVQPLSSIDPSNKDLVRGSVVIKCVK